MGDGLTTLSELIRFVLPHAKAGYEHMIGMICGLETAVAPRARAP
jgi:hypothetical protein